MGNAVDLQRIATASVSDVGCVREHNEDFSGEFRDSSGRRLFVVADGMGGHRGGATASRVGVETMGRVFERSTEGPEATLRRAFEAANQQIYEMARANPELRGMGTTAVALLLDLDATAWIGHVGDSRIYRLRSGRLEALTQDHSVVGEMMRQGILTLAQAEVHPRRNEILRSVGVESTVRPEVVEIDVAPGDRFLLCSDGLTGLASNEEIISFLGSQPPRQAASALVELSKSRGAPDNVTVQIAAIPAENGGAGDRTDGDDTPGRHGTPSSGKAKRPVAAALCLALLALLSAWLLSRS